MRLRFRTFAQAWELRQSRIQSEGTLRTPPAVTVLDDNWQTVAHLWLLAHPTVASHALRVHVTDLSGENVVELNFTHNPDVEIAWRRDIMSALFRLGVPVPERFAAVLKLRNAFQAAVTVSEEVRDLVTGVVPLDVIATVTDALTRLNIAVDTEALTVSTPLHVEPTAWATTPSA